MSIYYILLYDERSHDCLSHVNESEAPRAPARGILAKASKAYQRVKSPDGAFSGQPSIQADHPEALRHSDQMPV